MLTYRSEATPRVNFMSNLIFLDILHEALRRAEHPLPRIGYGAGAH